MTKVKAGNILPHITENRRLRKSKYKDTGLPEARFLTQVPNAWIIYKERTPYCCC